MQTENKETQLFYFCQYTCFYYSASSAPWEAAYINCFDENEKQVGVIVFTYEGVTAPPDQVNRINPPDATTAPAGLVVIYYPLSRYNDVVNQLRYAVNTHYCDCSQHGNPNEPHNMPLEKQTLYFSVNTALNTWAICNNLRMAAGAQYHA
jgi:hypothetical protein